ncbi:hypothetical protein JTE90_029541 [Oedothorax gibbosus]|uniref:Chitin-binding type-2 domain-containing protein n=1 Tax=Oedothorax gibbosus TaxID=931172 RepID=A0AAV6VBF2_9ARAC|nr:hypothetical protein JTE90_029541 [Oedothorax gibbosus]
MSIEASPSQLIEYSAPSEFGYFGKTGVYYDKLTGSSNEDSSGESFPPVSNPSLKLLCLIISSMVAVQEGNCQFCTSHNGLYPNVENCKSYFKCIKGVPLQKWCAPGKRFDVMSMSCTFPSKTVCAGSLVHLLPSFISNYQNQGGNNNLMQQMPQQQMMPQQGNNGHFHITLAVAKPNPYNGDGNGGDMQGNMMKLMQMIFMMMQNQNQGMNNNMIAGNQNYNNINQNMMNQNMNQKNGIMNQNMMNQNMNQNMNQQNGYYQNMNNQNMMNQNLNQNMMNQNMNQNMMNQNMNQNMMSQNMNQNMMNQNQNMMNQNMNNQNMMNQNTMSQGGNHKSKKQLTIVYDMNLTKFPIKLKLFG